MTGLPISLSIACWFVGTLWLVALLGHLLGAPAGLVDAAFIAGLVAACFEWLTLRRPRR